MASRALAYDEDARDVAVVRRFGRTERVLHWAHAGAFTAMLATGAVLYLPFLAQVISARPLMKALHLTAAVAWIAALILIPLLGDRGALKRTRRDLERFDDDDLLWLRPRRAVKPRQGRFNAGQKVHAVVQAALSVLFLVSGTLLWLGERNTALRFDGTLALHDMAMYAGAAFVFGHVYMAFAPDTRAALSGVVDGTVPADYAASHHAKWRATPVRPGESPAAPHVPSRPRLALAAVIIVLAALAATLLVRDVYVGERPRAPIVEQLGPTA